MTPHARNLWGRAVTTAREIMTERASYIEGTTTVVEAARKLASEEYGAPPICDGGRLQEMITVATSW